MHDDIQWPRMWTTRMTVTSGWILAAALICVPGPTLEAADSWESCHRACSPYSPWTIIPCECIVPDDEGGGTCLPDCADCSDCSEYEVSGGIIPRWELTGGLSYLGYSDVSVDGIATLADGVGLNLGGEFRFSERFGLQVGIANEQTELKSPALGLRQDVDLFSVGLGAAFHLTPFRRFDLRLEPRIRYRFEEKMEFGEIPAELGYGARLGLAVPLDSNANIGSRWMVGMFVGYHVEDAYEQVSFGLGFRREISP